MRGVEECEEKLDFDSRNGAKEERERDEGVKEEMLKRE